MNKIASLALASTLILTGCATTPLPAEKATPAAEVSAFQTKPAGAHGTILITRDEGFLGSGCAMTVTFDKQEVARLMPGETARFYKAPGIMIVGVGPKSMLCGGNWTEQAVEIPDGKTLRYRISLSGGSVYLMPTAY